ncbi:17-beta-hydroxysteroid dehydrogenase type 2 [Meriones unguiculatus]|uniref:17-beta-hydroxysteroid dehydrogenase type 2 n=1 Tax=Meriones unguiculatus TaxID=10047 RepID=UPI000B4EE042|nr:17-beta-hydroxysteroid dehydrogenase type 2 [Meriones unguiculatus]
MSPFSSESAWLCLAATSVLGGMLLCRSKSPGQWRRQMLCLAGLWGGACLLSLSLLCSLLLLSLGCFLLYVSSSDQELLPVDQKAVLVTGSDSGFGHALAKNLDKLGFTVFAGVLDEAGPGAEELRKTCSERLSVLQMDVTKPEQIKDTLSKVTEKIKDKGLWAVVNNAGIINFPIDGELIPMTSYRKCMAVNFFGTVEVTKTFLPLLRKSKGRLVNISSTAGRIPFQMMAAYISTKAAITMFSSVMRIELSKWGVKVITIQPGGFKTNIFGSPDTWDKMEMEILEHLSKEMQEDYGRDYVRAHKNHLLTMRDLSGSDITPVLRDIELAISAKNPSPFYAPGKMAYLWICLEAYFPTTVCDFVMQRYFGPKHIPRALRDSRF